MRPFAQRKSRGALLLATAAVAVGLATSPATAAPVHIDLCAKAGTLTLPGPVNVNVWGFALGDCTIAGPAQSPGPVLTVTQGDVVDVTVHNSLAEPVGFEVPGMSIANDTLAGTTTLTDQQTYHFTASAPGTYLYQSPAGAGRQVAMGLAGALVVNSTTAGTAYGSAATAFGQQKVLVLSAVDPNFNGNPGGFNMHDYKATYWLINGKPWPSADVIHGPAYQKVLLRYVNAGYDNTTMALVGLDEHVVARDANPVPHAFDARAETIPAGATEDAIVTLPSSVPSAYPNGFPLYNRQLHVTNGNNTPCPANMPCQPGGMMTFIRVP